MRTMTNRRRMRVFALAGAVTLTACTTTQVRTEQACLNPVHDGAGPTSFLDRFWSWAFGPACGDSDFYAGLAAFERQDFAAARDIWQQQADSGFARSQFHLAALYGNGWPGTEPDPVRAKRLFAAAVIQGYNSGYYSLVKTEGLRASKSDPWYVAVARAPAQARMNKLAADDVARPPTDARLDAPVRAADTIAVPNARPQPKPELDVFEAAALTEKSGGPSLIIPIPDDTAKLEPTPDEPHAPTLASVPTAPEPVLRPSEIVPFETGMTAYMRANYRDALRHWTTLAETGDARAQTWIGIMHDNGQGVPRDHRKAVGWYRRAADQGYAEAQFSLGVSHDKGLGVVENHTVAAEWYQRAAEQGHTDAQFRLGLMYLNGRGVDPDLRLAHVWFSFAAAAGDTIAQESKDLLALGMTPTEIVEAEALADSWQRRITAAGPNLTGS